MDLIRLSIPAKPEYVQTLRLVTASVANQFHFDIEAVDDLRVCVSEAVNGCILSSQQVEVSFLVDDKALNIRIGECRSCPDRQCRNEEMGMLILRSLLDDVQETDDGLVLIKYLPN